MEPHPGPEGGTAAAVAEAVLAHPSVLRLDGGPFGSIASYLPGRLLPGVRIGSGADPTEVAVVVTLGTPFGELADQLAARVRTVLGDGAPVEVTIADVGASAPAPEGDVPPAPGRPTGLA